MNSAKDKFVGILATVVFHVLLLVFLIFYYIKPTYAEQYSEPLEGVPVMFGNVADAGGDDEPFGRGSGGQELEDVTVEQTPEVQTTAPEEIKSTAPEVTDRPVVTQDFEETVAVREAKKAEQEKKKQEAIIAEQKRKEKAEADKKAAQEAQQKSEVDKQLAGLFGNGSGSGSRGNTEGTGTQGVPTGNASYGKTSGVGGFGSYDLGGRSVGRGGLILPNYTDNDNGLVVIDIIVDPQGNVIDATFGRGTNITSSKLKNESLSAARRTKFISVTKAGNQKGKITYKFNLK